MDWESGWSKKKLVTDQRSEHDERVPEETPQPQAKKPSFKAVGHIVMAMKRFQGKSYANAGKSVHSTVYKARCSKLACDLQLPSTQPTPMARLLTQDPVEALASSTLLSA